MKLDYRNHQLFFGSQGNEVNLLKFMEKQEGHPSYLYDLSAIKKRYFAFHENWSRKNSLKLHYAVKANGNIEILKAFLAWGAGVDIVSGGELRRVLHAGFKGHQVIFSGVGKSKAEIRLALKSNVYQLNVESVQELQRIADLARETSTQAQVAFRMNPNVNPVTHPYITTGLRENKFGMTEEQIPELLKILETSQKHIHLQGLTMHIGSQIQSTGVFRDAILKLINIYREFEQRGYPLKTIDIGGGLGIDYKTSNEVEDILSIGDYISLVQESLPTDIACDILMEPGRVLVARAGLLLCQVEYIKQNSSKKFAIVNSGMHHLLRPALYQASHRILPVQQRVDEPAEIYDVVGPICESSDFLGRDRLLRGVQQGDYLAICDAGAYGASMVSDYNDHERPKEVIF